MHGERDYGSQPEDVGHVGGADERGALMSVPSMALEPKQAT
jgi:hypothetical protein